MKMTYPEEIELDNVSESSQIRRRINEVLGISDKDRGFFEMVRTWKKEKKRIKGYATVTSRIRNAVTGRFTVHRVGTWQEYMYFTVVVATGHAKARGDTKGDPLVLYYDSPEEYEKHFGLELDKTMKREWYEREKKYSV
jgi:hypothetical protein